MSYESGWCKPHQLFIVLQWKEGEVVQIFAGTALNEWPAWICLVCHGLPRIITVSAENSEYFM